MPKFKIIHSDGQTTVDADGYDFIESGGVGWVQFTTYGATGTSPVLTMRTQHIRSIEREE